MPLARRVSSVRRDLAEGIVVPLGGAENLGREVWWNTARCTEGAKIADSIRRFLSALFEEVCVVSPAGFEPALSA